VTLKSYKDLIVWQKSVEVATDLISLSENFKKRSLYPLFDQIQRSAISIPSNIAEGSGRDSTKEFIRYISISYGSLCELETQLLIASKTKVIDTETFEKFSERISEIAKMLNGLEKNLKKKLLISEH
jgi:four helix bundle protein